MVAEGGVLAFRIMSAVRASELGQTILQFHLQLKLIAEYVAA